MTLLSLPERLAQQAFAAAKVPPVGPHFAYKHGPGLFLGRRGEGPLEVVWDTNVLIDYLTYGAQMWEGEPFHAPDGYSKSLKAWDCSSRSGRCATSAFTCFLSRSPTPSDG